MPNRSGELVREEERIRQAQQHAGEHEHRAENERRSAEARAGKGRHAAHRARPGAPRTSVRGGQFHATELNQGMTHHSTMCAPAALANVGAMSPLRVSDVALAAGLLVMDVGLAGNLLIDEEPWRLPVSAVIATLIAAAVLLRRRAPVPLLIGTVVVSASAAAFGLLWDPFVGAALVLYVVRPPRALPAAAGVAAVSAATAVVGQWWYAFGVPLALLTWGLAEAVRSRRAQTARQERQREHRILVDERVRIARELHDVVTHGMGLIAVKAGVANHVADSRPEEARDALRVIEQTSRAALGEMRRLLHVLRDETDETPADPLAALPQLAERARQAGVDVELSVLGTARVPEPVALAAYRIVQEAVTNVVKHAAPARCRVVVAVAAAEIRIQVSDDGTAPIGEFRLGHGLTGMRERVALYGGELVAGPGPDGGFRVAATLRCADA